MNYLPLIVHVTSVDRYVRYDLTVFYNGIRVVSILPEAVLVPAFEVQSEYFIGKLIKGISKFLTISICVSYFHKMQNSVTGTK